MTSKSTHASAPRLRVTYHDGTHVVVTGWSTALAAARRDAGARFHFAFDGTRDGGGYRGSESPIEPEAEGGNRGDLLAVISHECGELAE